MPTDIPTKEPETFRAGDTVKWKRSLGDYLASAGWTLKYSFRGSAGTIDITSTADGDDHLVELSFTTTAAYTAGLYHVQGYVESSTERHTIWTSRIEVLPNLVAAGSSYDGRSHVKKTLDAIEAVLENRASKEIEESAIEGVTIKRIPHEQLIMLREKYLQWYQSEQSAEQIKLGKNSGRTILTRFGS